MTLVLYDYQCIRPADAIQTPSEETQNEKEEREMCNIEQKQKADNGRDDGIIESLLDGKIPDGYVEVRSDIDTDDGEVSE